MWAIGRAGGGRAAYKGTTRRGASNDVSGQDEAQCSGARIDAGALGLGRQHSCVQQVCPSRVLFEVESRISPNTTRSDRDAPQSHFSTLSEC